MRRAYQHGTRAKYVSAKCRCEACTLANRTYAREREAAKRRGEGNGLVDAAAARAHLLALSKAGVGKRAVHAASDVALSVLQDVRTGAKTKIRAQVARRILAVDSGARADHSTVPAGPTRRALRELLELGLTKTDIAARLGSCAKTPALQLTCRRVTAANALKVSRLLTEVRREVSERGCDHCGLSHSESFRLAELGTYDAAELADLPRTWACLYGGAKGAALLTADLARLGLVLITREAA